MEITRYGVTPNTIINNSDDIFEFFDRALNNTFIVTDEKTGVDRLMKTYPFWLEICISEKVAKEFYIEHRYRELRTYTLKLEATVVTGIYIVKVHTYNYKEQCEFPIDRNIYV